VKFLSCQPGHYRNIKTRLLASNPYSVADFQIVFPNLVLQEAFRPLGILQGSGLGNPRNSRLGNLRYAGARANKKDPACAGSIPSPQPSIPIEIL
jgi:hypothetical protein